MNGQEIRRRLAGITVTSGAFLLRQWPRRVSPRPELHWRHWLPWATPSNGPDSRIPNPPRVVCSRS